MRTLRNFSTYVQFLLFSVLPSVVNAATMELFAIVGSGGCSSNLYYGPSSISLTGSSDGHGYYLSTDTPFNDAATRDWLQVVMVGQKELFRIMWAFNSDKTIAQRFADATTQGEAVTYTVVSSVQGVAGGTFFGTWWFNSRAQITTDTFRNSDTSCCFSSTGGLWGGASGSVDSNGRTGNFWGHGHFNRNGNECQKVYLRGQPYEVRSGDSGQAELVVSFMYHSTGTDPTVAPTVAPSARPSATASPTYPAPTPSPSFSPQPTIQGQELFAVVGGNSCAETLYYGPQDITTKGSRDGQHRYYLSTNTPYQDIAHTDWLQIVTSDGTTELFRVYWTFSTARTLAQHFATAVADGVAVSYRVVTAAGAVYEDTDTWSFSASSGITGDNFDIPSTRCCFSANGGAWGLGEAMVGGREVVAWGQGSFGAGDAADCADVYMKGQKHSSAGVSTATSHFYYIPDASSLNAGGGTLYALVQFSVSLVIHGVSAAEYAAANDDFNNLFSKCIAGAMYGVSEHDISNIEVTSYTSSDQTVLTTSDGVKLTLHSDAVQQSIQLSCTVRVENAGYSYEQMSSQLAYAVSDGSLNTLLHNYAVYLKLNDATDASASDVTTEQVTTTSGSSKHKNSSSVSTKSVTIAVVMVGVAIALALVWYFRDISSIKNLSQVNIGFGSTHSIDEEVGHHTNTNSSRHRGSRQRGRGMADREGDEEDGGDTLTALATPPRPARPTAASRAQDRYRAREGGSDQDTDTDTEGALQLEMGAAPRRGRPAQPRGATVVDFAVTNARAAAAPAEDIVEITPRSVFVAGSVPGRPSLTPVARAHLVGQQQGNGRNGSMSGGAVSVAPVAIAVATPLRGTSHITVASAEVIYS